MATNKGLGRGLGSLLGILDDKEDVEEKVEKVEVKQEYGEEVKTIDMGLIDVNPNQPRKVFDPTALSELAQSIKTHGVIQPILVTPRNNRYMIVAGERRFRASKLAEIKTIPCIVKDFDDAQVQEVALLENIQRQDLNPIETARALKELQDSYGWTQEALADRLGKSRPVIATTLIDTVEDTAPAKKRKMSAKDREAMIEKLTREMKQAAKELEFEKAAYLRDEIARLKSGK